VPITDKGLARARQVFTEHGGMLRTSEAIRLGIHPRTLYALRDSGENMRDAGSTASPLRRRSLAWTLFRSQFGFRVAFSAWSLPCPIMG
jgi:hypothetical protein